MTPTPTIDYRPANSRFHTDIGWLDSWHSFSFSDHYDAANTGHGLLIVSNDDRVAPAGGFGTHGHRDMVSSYSSTVNVTPCGDERIASNSASPRGAPSSPMPARRIESGYVSAQR